MMRIAITGALGHIGSALSRRIVDVIPDAEIVMVDNLTTQRYASLFDMPEKGRYRFIEADILETDLLPIVAGSHAVVHLAALTDAAASFKNKAQVERVNYEATVAVAGACRRAKCPMIHISSTSVYGTQKDVVREDCALEDLRPQSPYAETKLREEQYLNIDGASMGLAFVICRFGTICGVSSGMRFHTAINKFCWQAVIGQPLTVWRTALHQRRPYLFLQDAIDALLFIIENRIFDGRTYNILTANASVKEIIDMISAKVKDVSIEYVDTEIMNQLSYDVSCDRFKETGFEFKGSLRQGIDDTIRLLQNCQSLDRRRFDRAF